MHVIYLQGPCSKNKIVCSIAKRWMPDKLKKMSCMCGVNKNKWVWKQLKTLLHFKTMKLSLQHFDTILHHDGVAMVSVCYCISMEYLWFVSIGRTKTGQTAVTS